MKRFLISFIIGITLLAAGAATTFFEIQNYEFVNSTYTLKNSAKENFNLNSDEQVEIYFEDDDHSYSWDYDETMRDGEVSVILSDTVSYRIDGKRITVYERVSYSDYDYWNRGGYSFTELFDDFMTGLKDHKIYVYHDTSGVRIVSNRNTRKYVTIHN